MIISVLLLWSLAHCLHNITDTANKSCAFAVVVCCVIFPGCDSHFFFLEPKISLSVFDIPQVFFCDSADFLTRDIVQFFFDQFHTDFFCLR